MDRPKNKVRGNKNLEQVFFKKFLLEKEKMIGFIDAYEYPILEIFIYRFVKGSKHVYVNYNNQTNFVFGQFFELR